ncbi:MAG: hypothetical protein ACR2QU_08920, partial [Gammaproteobacteria bacterium]
GTGVGLLVLVFVYSFVFGFLGGRSPALKSGPIIMFAVMTGISNQQSYSFQGVVDGALMILLSGTIVTVVYFLFSPIRPEQALLHSLRRFFQGCAGVTRGFALVGPSERATAIRRRKHYLQSMVLPAPGIIQKAQQHLDYKLNPDNAADKVQQLHDSIQSVAYRLQSLDQARAGLNRDDLAISTSLVGVRRQLSEILQQVFESWARLEPGDAFEEQRTSLQQLSGDLQQELDALATDEDRQSIGEALRADLYAVLGCVRGLTEAMADTQTVINQINWPQWSATRF